MTEEKLIKAPPRDQCRRTPRWLFELIERTVLGRGRFQLDAAASQENALCKRYFDERVNGLLQRWHRRTFCNPGFAKFGTWIAKAYEETQRRPSERMIVALVGPTGCSQQWFHEYARRGTIFAPNRRVTFWDSLTGKPTAGADRDTMIYVLGDEWRNPGTGLGVPPAPLTDDVPFVVRRLDTASAENAWRRKHG